MVILSSSYFLYFTILLLSCKGLILTFFIQGQQGHRAYRRHDFPFLNEKKPRPFSKGRSP
ncbi:hypothetical protein CLOBOL_03267 [Enterocloster bolteae ATCC BAA-613]|uniref:Uncharacterized protein n=1 Tax=Enterocloster bolteae (strain ATCC BAA-613 / DSM 15670 / CCUG 46953 / JCM 12243 / WAL 16351) TaxID=411902 RepID=A8RSB9_ENTBW|nr:hypothetical protein CLOBOL_03267 [Enterocloster bolteae ATCC BAA-613]